MAFIVHNLYLAYPFLLTRLLRGVTMVTVGNRLAFKFLLTRLLRGVTTLWHDTESTEAISTHTPLTRRDLHWISHTSG